MPRRFIKGFKLDDQKVEQCFECPIAEIYDDIIAALRKEMGECRDQYLYVECGVEGPKNCLVIVLDHDDDEDKLRQRQMPSSTVVEDAKRILTAGVWLNEKWMEIDPTLTKSDGAVSRIGSLFVMQILTLFSCTSTDAFCLSIEMDEDWSDSDEKVLSEIQTSVLLGVPDGPIDKKTDVSDAAVSRIGDHPAFLPSREPSFSSSFCKICSNPMELLVQMWCPFEKSPMDRVLYIWGCPRSGCQTKAGSVRAWRGLGYNEQYATKLDKQCAKQKPKPLIVAGAAPSPGLFGLGAQIFGGDASVPLPAVDPVDDDPDSDAESSSSEHSLITAMASTTGMEYLSAQLKAKLPAGAQVSDPDDESKGGKAIFWAFAPYENSLEADHAFEIFIKQVVYEGEQCAQ
ncbi:hypothetical protein C8J56DRAFT_1157303 [Mycena floridula]|nr:hypothetical protein C8J56DRAFT_1157303 [Mycena floridula]